MKQRQEARLWSAVAAAMICLPALAGADSHGLKAMAEIKGCTDPGISGTAKLVEKTSAEGIKEVTVKMKVEGLSDGKHAVHIHEVGACEPCGAAQGHHDPGPFGKTTPDAPDFNHPFHGGDLVNLQVAGGVGTLTTTSSLR